MWIVHVLVQVKPDRIDDFIAATLDNARNSVCEPGIARFDVVQQKHDPTRFVLVEAYRTDDAPARHKETPHYLRWRDAVADMMAVPRTGITYENLFPGDRLWDMPKPSCE